MIKNIVFGLAILATSLLAEPYKAYSNGDVMKPKEDGSNGTALDIRKLYEYTDALCAHACSYPLVFDNEEEAEQAYNDSGLMASVFDYINKEVISTNKDIDTKDKVEFYDKFAQIYVSQHNFDVLGAKEKADALYEKMLSIDNNNTDIMCKYGEFLLNSSRAEKASEVLNKARELGSKQAYFGLAISELMNNNKDKDMEYLEIYCEEFSDNEHANSILSGLKSGDLKFEVIDR